MPRSISPLTALVVVAACTFDSTGLGQSGGAATSSEAGSESSGSTSAGSTSAATTDASATAAVTSDGTTTGVDPSATTSTTTNNTLTTNDLTTGDPTGDPTTDATTSTATTADPTDTTGDTTTADTTTGDPNVLVDVGLVVRYYLDEAKSGQDPLLALDAAPSPLDLPLKYETQGGMNPVYGGTNKHYGLQWSDPGLDGRATLPVAGTKVQMRLQGKTQATIEAVVDLVDVTPMASRIVHIGGGSESGWLTLRTDNKLKAQTYWQGNTLAGAWDLDWDQANRTVVHLVYDTNEQDPVDRVRFYVNGVERPDNGDMQTAPGLSQQIAMPDVSNTKTVHFTLGNRGEDVDRSFKGLLHYAAIYNVALTPADIAQNAGILAISDDSP